MGLCGPRCLSCSVGRHCLSWTRRLIKMRNGGKNKKIDQSLGGQPQPPHRSLHQRSDFTPLFLQMLSNHNSKSYFKCVFRLCSRHSILNISPYYLKADFIFPQSCDSKNSCPDTTRKGLKSLEDVDTTAGLQKKNIYFSLHHTVPYKTNHTEHQHPLGVGAL